MGTEEVIFDMEAKLAAAKKEVAANAAQLTERYGKAVVTAAKSAITAAFMIDYKATTCTVDIDEVDAAVGAFGGGQNRIAALLKFILWVEGELSKNNRAFEIQCSIEKRGKMAVHWKIPTS